MTNIKIGIPPLAGFVTKDAAEQDQTVMMGFKINCKDDYFHGLKPIMINSILDDFVYPEILKRVKDNNISPDFKLNKVHIVMYSNYRTNEILLNDEVRFIGLVKFQKQKNRKKGDNITMNEIDDVLGIYPDKTNDPNAAHIMLFKFKGKWSIAYDFTYNIKRAKNNIEKAKKEIMLVEKYVKDRKFQDIIKILLQATKLGVQAILGLNNYKISLNTGNNQLVELFSTYTNIGNMETKFSDHYKRLIELKGIVREQNKNMEGIIVLEAEVSDLIKITKELIEYIEKVLLAAEYYRKPAGGIYIQN